MSNQFVSPWPDGAVELLRKWHGEGLSMGTMVIDLAKSGYRFSRNAVIGKCHRLALPSRSNASNDGGRPKKPAKPRVRRIRASRAKPKPIKLPPVPVAAPDCAPVTLIAAKSWQCVWIDGEPNGPETLYCGAHRYGSLAYCGFHARIAYQPVTSRAEREAKRQAEAA